VIVTCFGAGTDITMADRSHRPIEAIRVGDRVLGYDVARSDWVGATVTRTDVHPAGEGEGEFILVNGSLRLTANHPVLTSGHATRADALRIGDPIVSLSDDGTPRIVRVTSVEHEASREVTYDLGVDGPRTYVAGHVVVLMKIPPP